MIGDTVQEMNLSFSRREFKQGHVKDSSQMASDPSTGVLERELMRLLEEEK